MARKAKPAFPWSQVVWTLLVANVVAGLLVSPATAIRRVRIENATEEQSVAVENAIRKLAGVPFLRANLNESMSKIEGMPSVRAAASSANLFGRAVIRIQQRTPVARVFHQSSLALGADGVIFSYPDLDKSLPTVKVPAVALNASTTPSGSWPADSVAQVCKLIQESLPPAPWVVAVEPSGEVILRSESNTPILLGAGKQWEKKITRLRQILSEKPELLDKISELNLVSPDNPAYRP